MIKIYYIFLYIKRWLSTTIHKDIGKGISSLKNFWYENEVRNHWIETKSKTLKNWDNLLKKLEVLIPIKSRYLIIILFWLVLLLEGNISQQRLIIFIVILTVIYMYKWLYVNISKLHVYIGNVEMLLLKIYKYKNPLMWLLIELEIKIFYFLYNLEKRGVKPLYVKWIYKILYNFTGINGIKIILYKFYNILKYWLKYRMYELVFKRMLGMILSILIFTGIIKKVLEILNSIYPSNIVWIYILLIIIPYIFNVCDINTILKNRMSVNLIWKILMEIDIKWSYVGNINVKAFLGFFYIVKVLNYENAIIYLICELNTNKWTEYNNKLLWYYALIIYECFDNFIHIRNMELKKEVCNKDVLNCCKYGILLNKLRVFYFWDMGKQLGIQETLLKIDLSIKSKDVNDLSTIPAGLSTNIIFLYDYNIYKLDNVYNNNKNFKLDKFFNIIENKQFHEKYIHYINDNEFKNKLNKINVYDNIQYPYCITLEEHMIYLEAENYRDWYTLKEIKQLIFESEQELNDWRVEWLKLNVGKDLEYKYEIIFSQIEEIKKKYKTNV